MIAKYRKQGKWNGLRGGYRKPAFPQGTGVERKTGTFRFPFHLNDPLCVTHYVCGFSSHEQFSVRNFTFFFSYEIFSVLQLSVSSVISVLQFFHRAVFFNFWQLNFLLLFSFSSSVLSFPLSSIMFSAFFFASLLPSSPRSSRTKKYILKTGSFIAPLPFSIEPNST